MKILRKCSDCEKWDDYVLENSGHPLQLWEWGNVKSFHGWTAERLFLIDNETDEIFACAQVLIRKLPFPFKSIAYIPRGPIVSETYKGDFLSLISDHVKAKFRCVSVIIEPDFEKYLMPDDWKLSKNQILPSKTLILDLNKSESDLLVNMSKKTRQYIRKSASENIEIKQVKSKEDLDLCLDIYHETNKRAGFNVHTDEYYYDVFNELGDHSPVFAVYFEGKPISFLWLIISSDTAFELYGGVNETGQQLRSNYTLKWHAIRKCKEWGLTRYDFGGLIDGGVSTFKKGWSDHENNLVGTYEKPLSPLFGVYSFVMPRAKKISQKIRSIISK